jgi:hypothetical protein
MGGGGAVADGDCSVIRSAARADNAGLSEDKSPPAQCVDPAGLAVSSHHPARTGIDRTVQFDVD